MESCYISKWLKRISIFLYLVLNILVFTPDLVAQQDQLDSLQQVLRQPNLTDSLRIHCLNKLATLGGRTNKQQGDSLYRQAIVLAHRTNNLYGEIRALVGLTKFECENGHHASSLKFLTQALKLAQRNNGSPLVTAAINDFYQDYFIYPSGDYGKELVYALDYLQLAERFAIPALVADASTQTGIVFALLGDFANALKHHQRALAIVEQPPYRQSLIRANALLFLGETHRYQGHYQQAIQAYKQSFQLATQLHSAVFAIENESDIAEVYRLQKRYRETFAIAFRTLAAYAHLKSDAGRSYLSLILARAYLDTTKPDSAIFFANNTVQLAAKVNDLDLLRSGHLVLSKAYALRKDFQTAYYHNLLFSKYEDSLFNKTKAYQTAYHQYAIELSVKESKIGLLEKDQVIRDGEARRQRQLLFGMVAGVALVLVVMLVLLRSYRSKQRANILLQQQKQAVQLTLSELKATQAQLIQKEKMASLGELTAGIAHEIQNPLNFVNNFSEVSEELVAELKEEIDKETLDKAYLKGVLDDLAQNQQKIHYHGQRADSIVKGMLQHSRASSGEKQPTDINALADEYLRLAYHGMRAKEKDFNADFKLDADPTLGKIEIVPQEIGRVLLNLFNNAFYATAQRKAHLNGQYQPQVTVTTKKVGNKAEISVRDNGTGIPESIKSKIFQPFFTTKPTGEGTGLGLSLSYDIITKGHGGELMVESKEGEYSEFIIRLPINS